MATETYEEIADEMTFRVEELEQMLYCFLFGSGTLLERAASLCDRYDSYKENV